MSKGPEIKISAFSGDDILANAGALGDLLHACVHAGASIGFVLPFTAGEAEAFWTGKVLSAVHDGTRVVLAAHLGARLAGTVQLDTDTPPNQPHRAEVRKLLVHPDLRQLGIARALMAELEADAARLGRSLMTLDTRTGDAAEPLYRSLGYTAAGTIPGYCRDPLTPQLDSTTIMFKVLDACHPGRA